MVPLECNIVGVCILRLVVLYLLALKCIGSVMVIVVASSVVDRGFLSNQRL